MDKLKHVKPLKEHEKDAINYIKEFYEYNSNINGAGSLHRYLNDIKKKLENKTITFKVKTGAQDRVFGTISNKQVSDKLKEMGYKIDKKCIKTDVAISSLGVTRVTIELHKKVVFNINVELVK